MDKNKEISLRLYEIAEELSSFSIYGPTGEETPFYDTAEELRKLANKLTDSK